MRLRKKMQGRNHPPEPGGVRLPLMVSVALILLPMVAGCAKIADPQPPEIHVPKPATDLTAFQRADKVVLRATLPQQNTDGTKEPTLDRIEVYRLAEEASENTNQKQLLPDKFRQHADLILSIPETRFSDYQSHNSLVIEDALSGVSQSLIFEHAYRYALLFVNDKNQAADFSNQAVITPLAIPGAPEEVTADVDEDAIHLRWSKPLYNMDGSTPPLISGYNVYRSMKKGELPEEPANTNLLPQPEFRDIHFEFDRTYYYWVSVIGSIRNPFAESLPSKATEVTPRDVFPPHPVEIFDASMVDGTVVLVWYPSPSPDVAGYRISRTDRDTATEQHLQGDLITGNTYRDTKAIPGRKFTYTITTVDRHGNESTGAVTEIMIR